jgi:hypothetical protein
VAVHQEEDMYVPVAKNMLGLILYITGFGHFCQFWAKISVSHKSMLLPHGGVIYIVASTQPGTKETGAIGREVLSRQGTGFKKNNDSILHTLAVFPSFELPNFYGENIKSLRRSLVCTFSIPCTAVLYSQMSPSGQIQTLNSGSRLLRLAHPI